VRFLTIPSFIRDRLLEEQIEHVDILYNIIKEYNVVLDNSDTGTGKTYCSIALSKLLDKTPFIVTKLSVIADFNRVGKHFDHGPLGIINYESIRRGKWRGVSGMGKIQQCPYITKLKDAENKFEWTLPENATIVFDEVHACRNHKTLNSKLIVSAKLQKIPIIMLSATIADNPLHLRILGWVIGLFKEKSDFYNWACKFGVYLNSWDAKQPFYDFEELFDDNDTPIYSTKLHKLISNKRSHRLKASEMKSFGEQLIISEPIYMGESGKKIQQIYEQMENRLIGLCEIASDANDFETPLVAQLRYRQMIEYKKLPIIYEMVENYIIEGNSTVIFLNFVESIMTLIELLNKSKVIGEVGLIIGNQTIEERNRVIEHFQKDSIRCVICNIKAGGQSISLHDINGKYPRISLINPSFDATEVKQALGRIYRAGGKSKAIQRFIFAAGTIEETIALKIKQKIRRIDTINDGDIIPIATLNSTSR